MILEWHKIEPYNQAMVKNVPNEDGVYALCTLQSDDTYKVRYVGQGNIQDRLKYHLSEQEQNEDLKNHISKGYTMKVFYAIVATQADRDSIELFLYNRFQPRYNHNTPPAEEELKVNIFNLN